MDIATILKGVQVFSDVFGSDEKKTQNASKPTKPIVTPFTGRQTALRKTAQQAGLSMNMETGKFDVDEKKLGGLWNDVIKPMQELVNTVDQTFSDIFRQQEPTVAEKTKERSASDERKNSDRRKVVATRTK